MCDPPRQEYIVFYLYHEDPESRQNLVFFLRHGVKPGSTYVWIVHGHHCSVDLPESTDAIPSKIVRKDNALDLVGFRWVVESLNNEDDALFHAGRYDYVFFLNSSCRGPFLAPSTGVDRWEDVFVRRMRSRNAHLVGPVLEVPFNAIRCPETGQMLSSVPFVHSYMLAMDAEAFAVVRDKVFRYLQDDTPRHTLLIIERYLSAALLHAGLRIDSLLLRYRNTDWLDRSQWTVAPADRGKLSCPEIPGNYQGIDLSPLEVVFFKNVRRVHEGRNATAAGISPSSRLLVDRYTQWCNEKH